jgi:hypothetical protein
MMLDHLYILNLLIFVDHYLPDIAMLDKLDEIVEKHRLSQFSKAQAIDRRPRQAPFLQSRARPLHENLRSYLTCLLIWI